MKGLEMAFETWVLTYLLNSLWQVPLVFLAALTWQMPWQLMRKPALGLALGR